MAGPPGRSPGQSSRPQEFPAGERGAWRASVYVFGREGGPGEGRGPWPAPWPLSEGPQRRGAWTGEASRVSPASSQAPRPVLSTRRDGARTTSCLVSGDPHGFSNDYTL